MLCIFSDNVRARLQLGGDFIGVFYGFFVFNMVFKARPKIHCHCPYLNLDLHNLFFVGEKYRNTDYHVIAAVAVLLWVFDVVLYRK